MRPAMRVARWALPGAGIVRAGAGRAGPAGRHRAAGAGPVWRDTRFGMLRPGLAEQVACFLPGDLKRPDGAVDRKLMRVLPRGKSELIRFLKHRAPVWSADPGAIGLTPQQAAQVAQAAEAAATARSEVYRLSVELASAVEAQDAAIAEARRLGGQCVRIISAHAAITENPGVYAAAQIPLPSAPSPIHPEAPTDLRFELQSDGSVLLRWRGSRRGGASFGIRRRITMPGEAAGPLVWLAHTDRSRYADCNIPAGALSATYQISALKGGREASGVETSIFFSCVAAAGASTEAMGMAEAA